MPTGPKLNRALLLAITLLVVLALGITRFDSYFRQPQHEAGDAAVNALQIDRAKHLHEIYGNYSRFEFNHPGPAFFYVYAGAEWLLHDKLHVVPTPANAHLFACLVLQALFFALALVVFYAHVRHRAFLPLALVAAGLYFAPLQDAFVSIWPPNQLLAPFLCFLVACVSLATGRIDHLPIAAVAGGFLFHGHVAQPMFVGGLGLLAVIVGWRQAGRDAGKDWRGVTRDHRGAVWATIALSIVFLLPLVIDVATLGSRSNVATILGRFWENREQSNSAFKSFLYFVTFATDTRDQETLFAHAGPELWRFLGHHVWRIAAWVAVFIVPTGITAWRRKRMPGNEARFLLTAGGFLAATVLLCILWGKAQAGAMYNFNGVFYYGIYYFALLLALALIAPLLNRFTPWPIGALFAAAAIGYFAWQERISGTAPDGFDVRNGTDAVLAKDTTGKPKLLVFEHRDWPQVMSLALELQRHHVDYYAAPWWAFMLERGHKLTRLGDKPEDQATIWWITHPGPGGTPLNSDLSVFTAPAPIKPDGDQISLAGGANGFRYVVEGLSAGNIDCATTELPRVLFRFATPRAADDVKVTFDAQALDLAPKEVQVDVRFNGGLVGHLVFTGRSKQTVVIPADQWNHQPTGDLELRLLNAVPKRQSRRPDYVWWAGLQLYTITFSPAR